MTATNWMAFKSGTDIRGTAMGGVRRKDFLSSRAVSAITAAYVAWLCDNLKLTTENMTVSVGHDSRLSAGRLKKIVIGTLRGLGVSVLDCGMSSTPAMFLTTVSLKCSGAIQITASHHPADRNGLKFFTRVGGLNAADITDILTRAQNAGKPVPGNPKDAEKCDYMNTYASSLREMICKGVNAIDYMRPLRGLKIAVDAGNGVGGFYAVKVLEPLGADISASRFLEPDGTFPNHSPNPENAQAMASIRDAVVEGNADFGVIFDTDVDRAACVGKGGVVFDRNRLVALASAIALDNNEGATIVTDSITSDGLTDFIRSLSGVHLRYRRGYKNVIDKQIELNESGVNCPLAIETSGHAAFRENYFLDDGAYLVTKIIIKMAELAKAGKPLESLIAGLREPVEESEKRFSIACEDFRAYGEKVIEDLHAFAADIEGWETTPDNYEGVRISTNKNKGSGWFLLRVSVHDPVLVLNCESDAPGGTEIMLRDVCDFLSGYDSINNN